MASIDVLDLDGAAVDTIELSDDWFGGPVNNHLMHEVVTAQLAAARAGTHSTKSRGEVSGGGRKPWRQKGTGRARHGSIRSPMWIGGGISHGPKPRDYTKRVNKKAKRAALRSALTDRLEAGAVTVVRGLAFDQPRTKDAVAALAALGYEDAKALVVLGGAYVATVKSFRNLPRAHVLTVDQLNVYDVISSDVVLFDEDALPLIGTGRRADAGEAEEVA